MKAFLRKLLGMQPYRIKYQAGYPSPKEQLLEAATGFDKKAARYDVDANEAGSHMRYAMEQAALSREAAAKYRQTAAMLDDDTTANTVAHHPV